MQMYCENETNGRDKSIVDMRRVIKFDSGGNHIV